MTPPLPPPLGPEREARISLSLVRETAEVMKLRWLLARTHDPVPMPERVFDWESLPFGWVRVSGIQATEMASIVVQQARPRPFAGLWVKRWWLRVDHPG